MRRALAALIVGALGFSIGAPAAAGPGSAADRPAHHRLKLACSPIPSPADTTTGPASPAVHCEWSPAVNAAANDVAAPVAYRLWRGAWAGRRLVYRGPETQAVDEKVRPCTTYRYKVHGVDLRGRITGASGVVKVHTPCRVRPVPAPAPKPKPVPRPEPVPVPKPVPVPDPKPRPLPDPKPLPEPVPVPDPKPVPDPAPVPDPKPLPDPDIRPAVELACRATAATAVDGGDDRLMRPTLWSPAEVTCKWAVRTPAGFAAERKVAGFRLWKATRNAEKNIVFKTDAEMSYVDRDVVPGGTYGYVVEAVDATGRTVATSTMVKVAVPGGTDPVPTTATKG